MADGLDHRRRAPVVIDNTKVGGTSGSLSGYLALITKANLPSEIFDSDGPHPAQNGGGDVRFTEDEAGTVVLPLHVVTFATDPDPANGQSEMKVRLNSLSKGADTTIYVWYDTAGTDSQPAVTDPAGRNAVYQDCLGAWRANTLSSWVDLTGGGNDFTLTGGTIVAGPFGDSVLIDAADGTDRATTPSVFNQDEDYTVATICELTDDDGLNRAHVWGLVKTDDNMEVQGEDSRFVVSGAILPAAFNYADNVLTVAHGVLPMTGDSISRWSNPSGAGNSDTTSDNASPADASLHLNHAPGESRLTSCRWDWIFVYGFLVDADWHLTEWNNHNDPATFASAGTPENVGGGVTGTADVIAGLSTVSAVAGLTVSGTASPTAQQAVADATTTVLISGIGTPSADNVSVNASGGAPKISGTASPNAQDASTNAAGSVKILASAAIVPDASSVNATVKAIASGAATPTAQDSSVSASAIVKVTGTASPQAEDAETEAVGRDPDTVDKRRHKSLYGKR